MNSWKVCIKLMTKVSKTDTETAIATYLHYSKTVLPKLAAQHPSRWPIQHDHCFQRVILDNVCGRAWYEAIPTPAYKNMTSEQARSAAKLSVEIATQQVCIHTLNNASLKWRDKQQAFSF